MNLSKIQPCILFLHIPKAAGRTLHQIIEKNYKKGCIYSIRGSRREESTQSFIHLSKQQRNGLKMVKGHMYFGLHQYLPEGSQYITMLRHPVDRVMSHYYFVWNTPNHYLHQEIRQKNISLVDYVAGGLSVELDNGQTRLISGREDVPWGKCTKSMLYEALSHMTQKFLVCGISERFDDTLHVLQQKLQWKDISYKQAHVNAERPRMNELPSHDRAIIEEYQKLDMQLYRAATEQLENDIRCLEPMGASVHEGKPS